MQTQAATLDGAAPAHPSQPSGPTPVYTGLLACMPLTLHSVSGEMVQVQGSPGFQVVYVRVGQELIAIPLDVAYQVGLAIRDHACDAQLRTLHYLRARPQSPEERELERTLGPLRRAGL